MQNKKTSYEELEQQLKLLQEQNLDLKKQVSSLEQENQEFQLSRSIHDIIDSQKSFATSVRVPETGYTWWSDNLYSLLGYERGEIDASLEVILQHTHPADSAKKMQHNFDSIYTFDDLQGIEFRLLTKNGDVKYVVATNDVQRGELGEPVEVHGFFQDITAKKKAQIGLIQKSVEFDEVLEAVNDPVFMHDKNMVLRYVNSKACRVLGYSKAELLEKTLLDIDSKSMSENIVQRMNQCFDNGCIVFETEHVTNNGQVIPVEVNTKVIEHEGTELYLSVARDLTPRKKLEAMSYDVERMLQHDLKNPLNNIQGGLQILETEDMAVDQKEWLNFIQEGAEQMSDLINEWKNFRNLEQGYLPRGEMFDLYDSLERIRKNFQYTGCNLSYDIRDVECLQNFCGQKVLLESMFNNLIRNACESSNNRAVILSSYEENMDIVFKVHNPGIIPKEIRENFFDKYITSGKKSGTGLGTYMAKLVARAHKGKIHYETSEKDGTSIYVKIPYLP